MKCKNKPKTHNFSSASGTFICEDIKISKNGISEVPLTLDSQEQSHLLPGQFKTRKMSKPKINFEKLEIIKHLGIFKLNLNF
jgi:hypothetical protein